MSHDCRGVKRLSPFALCKILPDLGTDRFVNVFAKGCVTSNPWVSSCLLTSVSFIWVFLHQIPNEVFGRVGDVIPVGGIKLIFCLEDLFKQLRVIFIIKKEGNHRARYRRSPRWTSSPQLCCTVSGRELPEQHSLGSRRPWTSHLLCPPFSTSQSH